MTEQTGISNPARANLARQSANNYRMVWRWHFYGGLFCIPFIILLCLTGPIYLFKPQVEAYIDRGFDHLVFTGEPKPAPTMVAAAVTAVPGGHFSAMEVRRDIHDAARIIVIRNGEKHRVYVHPQSLSILKQVPDDARFMSIVKTIHGELFAGRFGQVVVELAASWAIVMILTGLYLWWPRHTKGLAGLLYPRLNGGSRLFWRDIHAVTGIYVSGLALALLLSGLPWTYVWGNGFKFLRTLGHPAPVAQAWSQGRHDEHMAMMSAGSVDNDDARINSILVLARTLDVAPPALLAPPAMGGKLWSLTSDSGNRPARTTIKIDPDTLTVVRREVFADKPALDKVVGYGTAMHEGQLFGPANQALGLVTALGLMTLCVSALIMWWKRRPEGTLGAPMILPDQRLAPGLMVIIIALGIFLPVFGASLIGVGAIEFLVLRRLPSFQVWLGLKH